MSSSYAEPFERLEACLDELAAIDRIYRTTSEKQQALVGLSRTIARAHAERLRILASAEDVAESTGARTAAAWLAEETRDAPGTVRRDPAPAAALHRRWERVGAALAAGQVN